MIIFPSYFLILYCNHSANTYHGVSLRDRNLTNLLKSFNILQNNICMICIDLKDFFASKASKLDNSP